MGPGRQDGSDLGDKANPYKALEAADWKILKLQFTDPPTPVVLEDEGAHRKLEHMIPGNYYPKRISRLDYTHNMDGRGHQTTESPGTCHSVGAQGTGRGNTCAKAMQ